MAIAKKKKSSLSRKPETAA